MSAWSGSDVGWVVGHSYIVYAPLFQGCTTILYEGKPVGTPDAGAFWRVISEHGCVALFTAPTAFRAIKKEDPKGLQIGKYDMSKFRALFLAGERADPDTLKWAERMLKGSGNRPLVANRNGLVYRRQSGRARTAAGETRASACVPMPGYAIDVVDEQCQKMPADKIGSIARFVTVAARMLSDALAAG